MREGWKTKKLKEVCSIITDGTHQTPKYFDSGYIFLSSRNVTSGRIDWDNIKYIDEQQHQAMCKRLVPQINDILLAKNGTTGVAAIVDKEVVFDIYVSLALLRPKDFIYPKYLLYFINSPLAKNQFNKRLKGIGVPNLHLKEIREVEFPFPVDVSQQKEIVEFLDNTLAGIDKAKVNLEQNLLNAQELFQSKLDAIFSQRGEGWEEKTLKECGIIQTGTTPPTKDPSNFGNFIPFVKPAHFNSDGSIDSGDSMLSEHGLRRGRFFKENSVLMVCIGATIGKTGFSKIAVSSNQQINALTPYKEKFVPKLLYYGLISPYVQKQVISAGKGAQATLPIINKTKWEKIKINIPVSKRRQEEIVDVLDSLNNRTIQLEVLYVNKLEELEKLKKSLLQKSFDFSLTEKLIEV